MTHPNTMPLAAASLSSLRLLAMVAPLLVTAVLLAGWLSRRIRTRTGGRRPGAPAVKVAAFAAVGCTAYSADTSWRFAADYLHMGGTAERAAMFGAAELALFATALMARQNLTAQGAPGLPGVLTWVITGVQVIPAYAESGPVGGTVRAFVGPVMAAMLWHQAMGIELRLHRPEAASNSVFATLGREIRERLLSRLGIAERNRDAAQITRDRATARAVALAARLSERSPKCRENRRGRRIARKLSVAIARASVGTDPQQRLALLHQLAARRHATALATIDLPSPWTPAFTGDEQQPGEIQAEFRPPVPEDHPGNWLRTVPTAGPRGNRSPTGDRPDGHQPGLVTGTEPAATGDHAPDSDRPQEGGSSPVPGTDDAGGDMGEAGTRRGETAGQGRHKTIRRSGPRSLGPRSRSRRCGDRSPRGPSPPSSWRRGPKLCRHRLGDQLRGHG